MATAPRTPCPRVACPLVATNTQIRLALGDRGGARWQCQRIAARVEGRSHAERVRGTRVSVQMPCASLGASPHAAADPGCVCVCGIPGDCSRGFDALSDAGLVPRAQRGGAPPRPSLPLLCLCGCGRRFSRPHARASLAPYVSSRACRNWAMVGCNLGVSISEGFARDGLCSNAVCHRLVLLCADRRPWACAALCVRSVVGAFLVCRASCMLSFGLWAYEFLREGAWGQPSLQL